MFEDVGTPACGASAGEHRGHHRRGDFGEVEDHRGPELDVGLDRPVRATLAEFGQRGLLERGRRLVAGSVESLGGGALEQAALTELRERRPDRAIETNVEFWAAVILDFAEVPPHMMPAMFTSARTAGWSAHVLEQKRESKLVRPSAQYIGPGPRAPEDVEGWDTIKHD